MNANTKPNAQAVAHAVKTVKAQIENLRERIKTTTGDERAALEIEIVNLLESIGLEGSVEINAGEADGNTSTAAKILANVKAATDRASEITGTPVDAKEIDVTVVGQDGSVHKTHTTVENKKPGLWARFKLWCAENKKKVIVGALSLAAGAAGLWYWLNGKNTVNITSSVSDVNVSVEPTIPTGDADPSIFERIGGWIVNAASAVKGYAVAGWNWVKGLFTRNNNSEVIVETPVEIPVTA